MRDWDNKDGEEEAWLREHNSVNPQSLFMLLSNDGNVSLQRAGNGTNICRRESVFITQRNCNMRFWECCVTSTRCVTTAQKEKKKQRTS